jgi:ligand-binding sensor domain-containing protein
MNKILGALAPLCLLLALAATPTGALAAGAPRVAESFEVGASTYVRALKEEAAAGSLWVGTSSGVLEIDLKTGKPKNTFTRSDGLANEYVFAIGIDSQGYKWFGTNAGGASRYKAGKWKTYFPMHGLADYWIYAFANDRSGDLWIGTWAGANRYEMKTGRFKTYVRELINEWVYGLDVDAQGRVWFGTEGGVSMFDGKKWRSWSHKDGLGAANPAELPASPNTGLGTRSRHDLTTLTEGQQSYNPSYVFSILAAADGTVFAGTWGGGVSRLAGGKWTNLTTRDGLAGNIVYAIARDTAGTYWFGTDQGVSRYDGKAWHTIGRAQGLLDSHVYALAVTSNGDVWAGTRKGVSRIVQQ